MSHPEIVLILDFGSQFTQLIARRCRELGVYSEIAPYDAPLERINDPAVKALILSGGPQSVYDETSPKPDPGLLKLGKPVFGICYGMQWLAHNLGGKVDTSPAREYGKAYVNFEAANELFAGVGAGATQVWMSHTDKVTALPPGYLPIAATANCPYAGMADAAQRIYAIQFHPEVTHTVAGKEILGNFLFKIAGLQGGWNASAFIAEAVAQIRATVGEGKVLCALSGGVDSAVTALLVHQAIGDRLTSVFVDTGLLRHEEGKKIMERFGAKLQLNLRAVDASASFFKELAGVTDPEQKRKIIGRLFIETFEVEAKKIDNLHYLAQGTIYPDRIESAHGSKAATVIKSHHNVGGLPERMNLKLLEPLRDLFKDEVRKVGALLGLEPEFVGRHPFPGPGLAVRIIGDITPEKVALLQKADAVFMDEIRNAGLYGEISQAFAVLLPIRTVGVMGDYRTYDSVVALRAVATQDFMTADWYRFSGEFLDHVARRLVNEVAGISRVVYDITSKPPATIEWE
jgi:GMP synthase (glutamine-hydrolysing)